MHMAQLMQLPLTVSCFSKIQIGFTFLVPAHPGSPGQRAVKRVCVLCVCPPLVGMAEYCDEHVCLSVWSVVLCLSVHGQISRTTCPVFTKCFMHYSSCGSLLLMLLAAAPAELTVDNVCFRRQSSGMRVLVVVRSSLLSTQVRLFLPTSSVVQGLCNGRVSVCQSVCVVD